MAATKPANGTVTAAMVIRRSSALMVMPLILRRRTGPPSRIQTAVGGRFCAFATSSGGREQLGEADGQVLVAQPLGADADSADLARLAVGEHDHRLAGVLAP